MIDLKVEQPVNPPELTEAEKRSIEKFQAKKEAWIEEAVSDRMRDSEWVINALISQICDNPDTQKRMTDLILGHGDISIIIGNLRLDCMDWIRAQAKKEAERGMI
jgi:hypothetical protein